MMHLPYQLIPEKLTYEMNRRGFDVMKEKKNKDIMKSFQKIAKAFLIPASLIAAASLIMGISSFFTNELIIAQIPAFDNFWVQYIAGLVNKAGSIVMSNLPVIYAVTLASALCDGDREYAAFAGLMGYIAFMTGMNILLNTFPFVREMYPEKALTTVFGIETVNVGMFGGMMVGIVVAVLHSKLRHVKFPTIFSFFQGSRFIPFASTLLFILIGQVFPFIWVWFSKGINALAGGINGLGIFGPFVYATVEKLLIPTGLHSIWNAAIRDTAVSGIYTFASGTIIEGARPAYFQYLVEGMPEGAQLVDMVKFLRGGQIPMMMFALPAIALAIYHCADKDKRAMIKPLLIAGAFTAFFSNISEPIEFLFIFAAFPLYVIYSLLNGLSYLLLYAFGSEVGGITSSIIGFVLYGPMRPGSQWWWILIVGAIEGGVCYFLFRWWITKFNISTPGRGNDNEEALAFAAEVGGVSLNTKDSEADNPLKAKARTILQGLGGAENIVELDSCMSRLRVELHDGTKANDALLKTTGCSGVIHPGQNTIQVVYGLKVGEIKKAVRKEMELENNK